MHVQVVISIIYFALHTEWGLSPLEEGVLAGAIFIGILFGNLVVSFFVSSLIGSLLGDFVASFLFRVFLSWLRACCK